MTRSQHLKFCFRCDLLIGLVSGRTAIASYDKAIHIKPDKEEAFYNKACSYARQNDIEAAIAHLSRAIELNAEQNREMAKTDSDFDAIREHEAFQKLIAE